jgi:hypothetical protein
MNPLLPVIWRIKIMQDKTMPSELWRHRDFFERNNFFFGKLMTARDFTDEQSYFNEKRWLLNRLGLGWGVLCGLKVRPHGHDRGKVVVEPGVAIDQHGHEIVVRREEVVNLTAAQDPCPPEQSHLYYLSIKYEEFGVNPSPVLFDDCESPKELCVFNRIRESYRLIVTREKPVFTNIPLSDLKDILHCETASHRFLQHPAQLISQRCPERLECEVVPLARICYNPATETTAMDIDIGPANRKLAFSNEILYELIWSLQQEVRQGEPGHYSRSRHVPLLASTIKGLTFQDGRNARLDQHNGYEGRYPFRLTSDGDFIWITDREDEQIWRINRKTNRPVKDHRLSLEHPSWGIAYDGLYMWITHHAAFQAPPGPEHGKLTRVNVCTLERRTISALPMCEDLPHCSKFPESADFPGNVKIHPNPGEIVLHDGDIYVAHDRLKEHGDSGPYHEGRPRPRPHPGGREDVYHLGLTRIDPVKGCIVEFIDLPESQDFEPLSPIKAMASDGDALWITYQASSNERRGGGTAILRKITKDHHGKSVISAPYELKGELPERMAFDGTRLWTSHDDGISVIEVRTGELERVDTKTAHTGLAYGGESLLWAAVSGKGEAFISRIDIFSEEEVQRLELVEVDSQSKTAIEISDMQFDGTYIYVAYHLEHNQVKKGVIHRLLP